MDFKQVLNELKNINGNNSCIDCGAPDPQWASINYGTFLCSKCFDEHRLLDESSVRSITIDTWNEEQILRMKLGGNDRAERFFTNQPEYRKNMSIKEQYSSNFANTYANKLTKICQKYIENADNQMSPISTTSGISTSSEINIESNESNNNDNNNNSKNNSKNTSPSSANSNWENIYLFNSDPSDMLDPNKKEFDNITLIRAYRPSKERNEEFFARKGRENEQRDENLPPSKGGKYTGFGSKPLRTEKDLKNEGITQFQKRLSTGWDFLTSAVNSINENVIKPASNKVRDPQFTQNLENYAENIKRTFTEKVYNAKDHAKGQINNAKDQISNAKDQISNVKDHAKDHINNAKDQISNAKDHAKDQINNVVQNIQKNIDELTIASLESDSSSNDNKSAIESYIVIDYDYIENSDNDIFNYPVSENKFLTVQTNNENDFYNRRASTNSFTSINETLTRAFSNSSVIAQKIVKSHRSSSRSSLNMSTLNSPI